jgi:hypothetical protein
MAVKMPETPQHLHGEIGEDYNIRTIVSVAVIGFLTLVLTVVWLKAIWARAERYELETRVFPEESSALRDLRTAQETKLQGYQWTDAAHGKVSIPVTDAMGQVLVQLQADQRNERSTEQTSPVSGNIQPPPTAAPGTVPAEGSAAAGEVARQTTGGTPPAAVPAGDAVDGRTSPVPDDKQHGQPAPGKPQNGQSK